MMDVSVLIGKVRLALSDDRIATIGAADALPVLIAAYGEGQAQEVPTIGPRQYDKAVLAEALRVLEPEPETESEPEPVMLPVETLPTQDDPALIAPATPDDRTDDDSTESPLTKARVRRP